MWVLIVSVGSGAPTGGSGTQYFLGSFDGTTFTPAARVPSIGADDEGLRELDWLDWGRDCYAGVTFSGLPDDQRTLLAWMSNWEYAQDFPSHPWRGSMTIARRLTLREGGEHPVLCQTPILPRPRVGSSLTHEYELLLHGEPLTAWALPACALVNVKAACAPDGWVELTLRGSDETLARIVYDNRAKTVTVSRPNQVD
jgi:levanase/fructan beta-fructosidase/levanbiose-producing levanase